VKEGEALVDVLDLVDAHFSGVRLAQLLAGDDLQQPHQVLAVRQVDEQVVDLEKANFMILKICRQKLAK
jgi:hypothetical protein